MSMQCVALTATTASPAAIKLATVLTVATIARNAILLGCIYYSFFSLFISLATHTHMCTTLLSFSHRCRSLSMQFRKTNKRNEHVRVRACLCIRSFCQQRYLFDANRVFIHFSSIQCYVTFIFAPLHSLSLSVSLSHLFRSPVRSLLFFCM